MRLISISFKAIPRMPGVRPGDLATINCDKPSESLRGWRIAIRGQQAFFISPQGWLRDQNIKTRDIKGQVTVFEMPRTEVFLQWETDPDELDILTKGGKFESPPFGWMPTAVLGDKPIIEQIPASHMGDV